MDGFHVREVGLSTSEAPQPNWCAARAFVAFPALLLGQDGRDLAGGSPGDITAAARSVAIGAGLVAFVVTLFGALPAAVWLTKRKHVSLGLALLLGLAMGNVPMVVGTALAGAYGIEGFVRGAAFSSLLGMTGAAVFWAIAIRGPQADRDRVV